MALYHEEYKEFIELAREHCRVRDLSIASVARRMGISREELSRLLNGRSKPFGYKVAALATALRLDEDEEQELWRVAGRLPTPSPLRHLCVCERVLPTRQPTRPSRDRTESKNTLFLANLIEWYGGLEKLRADIVLDLKIVGGGHTTRGKQLLEQLQDYRRRRV